MNDAIRSTLFVLAGPVTFASFIALGQCASREKTVSAEAVRVDTIESEHAKELRAIVEEYAESMTHTASDTAQPLRFAETRTAHFPKPATPTGYPGPVVRPTPPSVVAYPGPVQSQSRALTTQAQATTTLPILDERPRQAVCYPIPKNLTAARINVLLQPNLEAVTIRLWSIPAWRELMRVENGTFPVNLWRKRQGVASFVRQVRVAAGPEPPIGNPQVTLSSTDFRGGDVLCIEAAGSRGPLWVVADPRTGLIVLPLVGVIEQSSNDATGMPGQWSTVSGVKP